MTTTTRSRKSLGSIEISAKQVSTAVRIIKPLAKLPGRQMEVHIGTDAGDIYVEAGGVYEHARVFVDGRIFANIDAVVALGDLEAALKGAASDSIDISVTDNGVEIASGRRTVTLPDLDDEEFRGLDYVTDEKLMHGGPLDIDLLLRAASHASTDETRPLLCVTHLEHDGHGGRVVTSDSYRMFVAELPGRLAPGVDINLNTRTLVAALKTIQAGNGFDIFDAGQHVMIDTGLTQWVSSKVEGQFPNYRQLVPETFEHEATLDRKALLDAVVAAQRYLSTSEPLRVDFSGEELVVSTAAGTDRPRSRETIAWSGMWNLNDPLIIGLNAVFTVAALKALAGATVKVKVISPLRPVLWEGDDAQVLAMPLRLADR
jgi:DNA polymerase-3 subunit beta